MNNSGEKVAVEGTVPVLNADGSQRQQKVVDANGVQSFVGVTQTIPVYQLISPGGDTQAVANFEYRIPIVGPVTLAAFFDAGINRITRTDQLTLKSDRLTTLNSQFPRMNDLTTRTWLPLLENCCGRG